MMSRHDEEECVCLVSKNRTTKLALMSCRGSATVKDFQQDAKALLSWVENPIKAHKKDGLTE